MSLTVEDINSLQQYIVGVMNRADHHAGNVNEIVLALAGAIVWEKDDTPIRVMRDLLANSSPLRGED